LPGNRYPARLSIAWKVPVYLQRDSMSPQLLTLAGKVSLRLRQRYRMCPLVPEPGGSPVSTPSISGMQMRKPRRLLWFAIRRPIHHHGSQRVMARAIPRPPWRTISPFVTSAFLERTSQMSCGIWACRSIPSRSSRTLGRAVAPSRGVGLRVRRGRMIKPHDIPT
jgi:hypothetical protein